MRKAGEILEKLNNLKVGQDIDLYGNRLIPNDVLPKLEKIAKDVMLIDTLKTQYSDDKDFHDVACWSVAEALYQAYLLGQQSKELREEVCVSEFKKSDLKNKTIKELKSIVKKEFRKIPPFLNDMSKEEIIDMLCEPDYD